ncbi:MAG: hypothetical protein GY694_14505, partial [Gammaproteobacteria bacterium]|nr:hypothetical protein [Gammaproteobacteria bacterium]
MDFLTVGDKEITIKELTIDDAESVDIEILESINQVLDAWQSWDKSGFELIIAKPKIFLSLLCKSTGQKKK